MKTLMKQIALLAVCLSNAYALDLGTKPLYYGQKFYAIDCITEEVHPAQGLYGYETRSCLKGQFVSYQIKDNVVYNKENLSDVLPIEKFSRAIKKFKNLREEYSQKDYTYMLFTSLAFIPSDNDKISGTLLTVALLPIGFVADVLTSPVQVPLSKLNKVVRGKPMRHYAVAGALSSWSKFGKKQLSEINPIRGFKARLNKNYFKKIQKIIKSVK